MLGTLLKSHFQVELQFEAHYLTGATATKTSPEETSFLYSGMSFNELWSPNHTTVDAGGPQNAPHRPDTTSQW
jgi:hypothetical protein